MRNISIASISLLSILNPMNAISGEKTKQSPNIVLIMCDDMGFSDLGCYGGEVNTPNIDFLGKNGVRFTQFKNSGRSCPSRAALMTGYYQHEAGMGWMTAVDEHRPGYRGQIRNDIPTIAEILGQNGYANYLSGKWHVTVDGAFNQPNGSYPIQRGFDKYYGCLSGGGSYYKPTPVYSDLNRITELPDDYYYTTAITDSAVSFIHQHPKEEPMFLYIAHYAPHLPLQAPKERVDACRERYRVGYDVLKKQRFERQQVLGIFNTEQQLPIHQKEFGENRPAWESLDKKKQEQWITDMATFAAMIEIMDDGIGEVIQATKEQGIYENTVFIFLSDNGATNEGGYLGQLMADLSNTPFRSYKQWTFQGGTSSPLIIMHGDENKNTQKGLFCNEASHIIDIFPTCLDLAHAEYPAKFQGNKVRLPGISLLPATENKKIKKRDLYFEHQTSCAIISDGWKLVRANGKTPWELINLEADPFETTDISAQYPDKVIKLEKKWNKWAKQQSVFPFEYRPWTKRINYYKSQNANQSGID